VKEEVWGLLGFVALVCVWVYFCCCGLEYLCHRGLELCEVGTVGWSAGGECVGEKGSLVTGWGEWVGR
jgi:hypothetical protein